MASEAQRCEPEYDDYGNEIGGELIYCVFPDCGCDGARLCMAKKGASERASGGNVEGMWSGKTREQREAVFNLVGSLKR